MPASSPPSSSSSSSSSSSFSSCRILWSTQSGRAKACARRTARILEERTGLPLEGGIGCPFDETEVPLLDLLRWSGGSGSGSGNCNSARGTLFLMFVSTTGDGEHCDTIRNTWRSLLQKSLPGNLLGSNNNSNSSNININNSSSSSSSSPHAFGLFCLGDRAYGPQFCAAGRKLGVRLLRLGMRSVCDVGYGDDNTPGGGVFRDLDGWLEEQLLPRILQECSMSRMTTTTTRTTTTTMTMTTTTPGLFSPFAVKVLEQPKPIATAAEASPESTNNNNNSNEKEKEKETVEWKKAFYEESYREYFRARGPITAYDYDYDYEPSTGERIIATAAAAAAAVAAAGGTKSNPLIGRVTVNDRITAPDWNQDTRHLEIRLTRQQHTDDSNGEKNDKPDDGGEKNDKPDSNNNNSHNNNNNNNSKSTLPYVAGDVASVLPFNSRREVDRFLTVLPDSVSSLADAPLEIALDESFATDNRFTTWPIRCTLRGWLTHCADIHSLPEREDLRALGSCCAPTVHGSDNHNHNDSGLDQAQKLVSLSETSEAALYADYVLREKRSWIDVLHDFESLRAEGSMLTLGALLVLLPPMRPRDFSIASAPSMDRIRAAPTSTTTTTTTTATATTSTATPGDDKERGFSIELCVGVVEGKTRLGREYHGLCSRFLSRIVPGRTQELLVWIRPGTFGRMPRELSLNNGLFEVPIVCVGAGTGIAPMRSLLLERMALKSLAVRQRATREVDVDVDVDIDVDVGFEDGTTTGSDHAASDTRTEENILVFGCRKKSADYYYRDEWERQLSDDDDDNNNSGTPQNFRILTAFSQDQAHKIYVQKVLREADGGNLIARHILERGGAVYIAGGPKMARAVKQELVEALAESLPAGEKQAQQVLNKMQRMGRFGIEAWS